MVKKITKIGNSQGIIFDQTLMELAHLKVGDEVNVTIHEGGAVTMSPCKPKINREDVSKVIDDVMQDYSETMQKLA